MNSFFGLGPMELFLIVFIALVVLGPQRLPGTIREVMKYWRYFRNLSGELTSQLGEEFKDLDDLNPQRMLKDLADELDSEVEQTQQAAGVKKKKPAKKPATTTKPKPASAAKKSTKKSPTSSATKKVSPAKDADDQVEPFRRGEGSVAAISKKTQSDKSDLSNSDTKEEGSSTSSQPSPASNNGADSSIGDVPSKNDASKNDRSEAATSVEEPSENTILPPSRTPDTVSSDTATSDTVSSDNGSVNNEEEPADDMGEPVVAAQDDGDDDSNIADGHEPVRVNGKGGGPKDEG